MYFRLGARHTAIAMTERSCILHTNKACVKESIHLSGPQRLMGVALILYRLELRFEYSLE